MTKFDFTHQPLDIALRQLLMHMSLPKETQQIDRVVEAFAVRYEQCEPGLFKDKGKLYLAQGMIMLMIDNTYVVAFSMMMLHTDAFNKHNKNKMSKADYVRNTRMEGVSPLVLEVCCVLEQELIIGILR
jgi:Sec7-like guanine-nucleotide exchange factor